jgi:hypothetical protein
MPDCHVWIQQWHGGGIRQATKEELPYLQQRINESKEEKVRLYIEVEGLNGKEIVPLVMIWVGVQDGKLVGQLPLRMIWQAEPLMIFPEVKNKSLKRRIALGLPRAMESFIGDRSVNKTGIYSYFFVTKGRLWAKLARAFGCLRIYKGCMTFGKDL